MNSKIEEITDFSTEEKVKLIIQNKYDFHTDKETEFNDMNLKDKSYDQITEILNKEFESKSIVDVLSSKETKDDGGVVALSGFYFQFLVTVDYLVELINGEWDAILLDLHQDIILISEKKIRVIQVKSSTISNFTVGESGIYNDHWIQKLFHIKGITNSLNLNIEKIEFELVTNFLIRDVNNIPIEYFEHNSDFSFEDLIIENNFNELIDRIIKFPLDHEEYLEINNKESIKQLLKNFKITKRSLSEYFDTVASKFGELGDKGIKATLNDINSLIGFLFEKCTYHDNPSMQIIDKKIGEKIKLDYEKIFLDRSTRHVEKKSSLHFIKEYIIELAMHFKEKKIFSVLEKYINEFENEIIDCVTNDENIFILLNRYVKRVSISSDFDASLTEKSVTKNKLKFMLNIVFCLKILEDGKVSIDKKQKNLLLQSVGEKIYGLFEIGKGYSYHDAHNLFEEVFKNLEYTEQLRLIKLKMQLVLGGGFEDEDSNFKYGERFEINLKNSPTEDEMSQIISKHENNENNFTIYKHSIEIINGSDYIIGDLYSSNFKRSKNIEELKKIIDTGLRCGNE